MTQLFLLMLVETKNKDCRQVGVKPESGSSLALNAACKANAAHKDPKSWKRQQKFSKCCSNSDLKGQRLDITIVIRTVVFAAS